jgi:hypothetical protein
MANAVAGPSGHTKTSAQIMHDVLMQYAANNAGPFANEAEALVPQLVAILEADLIKAKKLIP